MKQLTAATAVTLAILGAACAGGGSGSEEVSRSGCSSDDALATQDVIWPMHVEFSDHVDRLSSTSRIALEPVIADMQRVIRDLRSEEVPRCASALQADLVKAWDAMTDAALAFQGDESESTVERMCENATLLLDRATDGIVDINLDVLNAANDP